jgi:hypothetical protein
LASEFKDISAYPSEKRNEHRKRQALFKELADQIASKLGGALPHCDVVKHLSHSDLHPSPV